MAEHSRDGRLLISTTLVVNMLDGKVMFECKNNQIDLFYADDFVHSIKLWKTEGGSH